MSSVLVTGSSGFLGNAITSQLLAQRHDVIGLDPVAATDPQYHAVLDDLSDSARIELLLRSEQVTHIIHAGGISGPMVMPNQPDRLMAVNVGGSVNLITAALTAGDKTFVYCSSVSAVGPYYEAIPIGADYPLRPIDPYGCSKAAVDMMLRGLSSRVQLDICSLRFPGIYGPGRKTSSIIDAIVSAAIAGESIRLPRQGDYPYVYIDDAVTATIAACLSKHRKELVYYISYPEQVTMNDLLHAAEEHTQAVTLVIDEAHRADPRGPVDIRPAQRDFGYAPTVDHREGIRRMIEARKKLEAIS
jgi:nucleoside-diphosphate-sugar epimerase